MASLCHPPPTSPHLEARPPLVHSSPTPTPTPTPDSLVAQTTPGDPGRARLFFSLIRCFPFFLGVFLNPYGPFCLGFVDDSSTLGLVVSGDFPDSPQM